MSNEETEEASICGATAKSTGDPCQRPAGWGTDSSSGRCKFHGGASTGAPKNNGNAEKAGLRSDPKKYKARQSESEEDWIRSVRESILDRMRTRGREPDFLDRVLAERVAINLHMAANASEYVDEEGLIQTVFVEDGGYEKDIPNGLVTELRQFDKDIIGNLKKLGVLNDPDSQQAEATESLAVVLSDDS